MIGSIYGYHNVCSLNNLQTTKSPRGNPQILDVSPFYISKIHEKSMEPTLSSMPFNPRFHSNHASQSPLLLRYHKHNFTTIGSQTGPQKGPSPVHLPSPFYKHPIISPQDTIFQAFRWIRSNVPTFPCSKAQLYHHKRVHLFHRTYLCYRLPIIPLRI
jgi:hypothetical protein